MSSCPQCRFVLGTSGFIYYKLDNFQVAERTFIEPSNISFALVQFDVIKRIENDKTFMLGYIFKCEGEVTVSPSYLHFVVNNDGVEDGEYEPYVGVPGIQFYQTDVDLFAVSTLVTNYYTRIDGSII